MPVGAASPVLGLGVTALHQGLIEFGQHGRIATNRGCNLLGGYAQTGRNVCELVSGSRTVAKFRPDCSHRSAPSVHVARVLLRHEVRA